MKKAGYRFVPIETPPTAARKAYDAYDAYDALDLSRPHPEGSISGELEVTWEARTPVCIGVTDGGEGARRIEPLRIGGYYCLPGSSIRGMLRSVVSIAANTHLGDINHHRHFGYRDFDSDAPDGPDYRDRVNPRNVRSGWLHHDEQEDAWFLTPSGEEGAIFPVRIEELLDLERKLAADVDDWRGLTLQEKRHRLASYATTKRFLGRTTFRRGDEYFASIRRGHIHRQGEESNAPLGYLVLGGAAEASKVNEVFVCLPRRNAKSFPLGPAFMSLFNQVNSNPGDKNPTPIGSWRYWLVQKRWTQAFGFERDNTNDAPVIGDSFPGIPVFYVGDPTDGAANGPETSEEDLIRRRHEIAQGNFFMGLSRLIKIPYRRGVSAVAARLYPNSTAAGGKGEPLYRAPKLAEADGLDMARALFGHVDVEDSRTAAEARHTDALAGRVAVAPAFCEDPNPRFYPGGGASKTFVFGRPRESFYTFYLIDHSGHPARYDGDEGVPAGRKRYPVRRKMTPPEIPNDNRSVQSEVRFLAAGTRFQGRIRVHNLLPEELGALLWALTFGKPGGDYWHSIGRAKAFGYGALSAKIRWKREPLAVNWADVGFPPDSIKDAIAAFECWMDNNRAPGVPDFADRRSIQRLRAYASPDAAARAAPGDALAFPAVEAFRDLKNRGIAVDYAAPNGSREPW